MQTQSKLSRRQQNEFVRQAVGNRKCSSSCLRYLLILGLQGVHQVHSGVQMDHSHAASETMSNADPANQEWARQRLAKSSRHQEWIKIKYKPSGGGAEREVSAFVVYPEVKAKATVVIVIHEIFGMSDWVRSLTDQLAEAGYVAIAQICFQAEDLTGAARAILRLSAQTRSAQL